MTTAIACAREGLSQKNTRRFGSHTILDGVAHRQPGANVGLTVGSGSVDYGRAVPTEQRGPPLFVPVQAGYVSLPEPHTASIIIGGDGPVGADSPINRLRQKRWRRRRWYELPDVERMGWRQIAGILLLVFLSSITIFGCYVVIVGVPDGELYTFDAILKELFNVHQHGSGHGHDH